MHYLHGYPIRYTMPSMDNELGTELDLAGLRCGVESLQKATESLATGMHGPEGRYARACLREAARCLSAARMALREAEQYEAYDDQHEAWRK